MNKNKNCTNLEKIFIKNIKNNRLKKDKILNKTKKQQKKGNKMFLKRIDLIDKICKKEKLENKECVELVTLFGKNSIKAKNLKNLVSNTRKRIMKNIKDNTTGKKLTKKVCK